MHWSLNKKNTHPNWPGGAGVCHFVVTNQKSSNYSPSGLYKITNQGQHPRLPRTTKWGSRPHFWDVIFVVICGGRPYKMADLQKQADAEHTNLPSTKCQRYVYNFQIHFVEKRHGPKCRLDSSAIKGLKIFTEHQNPKSIRLIQNNWKHASTKNSCHYRIIWIIIWNILKLSECMTWVSHL